MAGRDKRNLAKTNPNEIYNLDKRSREQEGARVNLAAALAQLKKYKEAITHLQEAVRLAPDNAAVHFNLGTLYGNFGNYGKAIKHLQVVVEKNPKDSQAHLALANALRNEQQFEKAIEHYKAALSIDPGLTWGWVDMSSALSSVGQHSEALKVLEEAHFRIPYDGPIAHALALLLVTSPDLAQRQGQRALELASKSSQDTAVLKNLKNNLEYFKTHRPCRVPPQ